MSQYDHCEVCGTEFVGTSRRYCGDRCRQVASRARRSQDRDVMLRALSRGGPGDPMSVAAAALVRAAEASDLLDVQRRCDRALRILLTGSDRSP